MSFSIFTHRSRAELYPACSIPNTKDAGGPYYETTYLKTADVLDARTQMFHNRKASEYFDTYSRTSKRWFCILTEIATYSSMLNLWEFTTQALIQSSTRDSIQRYYNMNFFYSCVIC